MFYIVDYIIIRIHMLYLYIENAISTGFME